jgi:CubicO group peptidase (beta-lactamase class C family)
LAAAGLWSTPTDLARFVLGIREAYLEQEGAILDMPLAQEMLTRQNEVYGLGPGVFGSGDSLWFAHSGGNAGFRAYVLLYPATGDGVAVMTNANSGRALNFEIIRAVSQVYDWPSNKPEVRTEVMLPPDTLDVYTGTYRIADGTGRVLQVERKDTHLYLAWSAAAEEKRQRLVPTSTTEFVVSETGALVVFGSEEQPAVMEVDGRRAERIE